MNYFDKITLEKVCTLLSSAFQFVDFLRLVKRLQPEIVSKTPEQWVLQDYPSGYSISEGKLLNESGDPIKDVSRELELWQYAIAAFTAWRMVAAVLENEESFRDQQNGSLLRQHHRLFIERFLPWDRRGPI